MAVLRVVVVGTAVDFRILFVQQHQPTPSSGVAGWWWS